MIFDIYAIGFLFCLFMMCLVVRNAVNRDKYKKWAETPNVTTASALILSLFWFVFVPVGVVYIVKGKVKS